MGANIGHLEEAPGDRTEEAREPVAVWGPTGMWVHSGGHEDHLCVRVISNTTLLLYKYPNWGNDKLCYILDVVHYQQR